MTCKNRMVLFVQWMVLMEWNTAYLTSTISFGLRNPILLFKMCCTPPVIAVHSTLLCNDLRDEESHSSADVTKREVHLHTIGLASAKSHQ